MNDTNVQIKRSQGDHYNLLINDDDVRNHFANRSNYTGAIMDQLEKEMYSFYFKDKNDLVVLDLGANIGLFSIHVSDCCRKIFAIEPTPSHFSVLEKNLKSLDNTKPLNYALSSSDGQIEFFLYDGNSTMNSLSKRSHNGQRILVDGITFKSLLGKIEETKIDFCKIDIEGSEYFSITKESIADVKDNIDNFFIEVHEVEGKSFSFMINHFKEIFESNGYKTSILGIDGLFASKA